MPILDLSQVLPSLWSKLIQSKWSWPWPYRGGEEMRNLDISNVSMEVIDNSITFSNKNQETPIFIKAHPVENNGNTEVKSTVTREVTDSYTYRTKTTKGIKRNSTDSAKASMKIGDFGGELGISETVESNFGEETSDSSTHTEKSSDTINFSIPAHSTVNLLEVHEIQETTANYKVNIKISGKAKWVSVFPPMFGAFSPPSVGIAEMDIGTLLGFAPDLFLKDPQDSNSYLFSAEGVLQYSIETVKWVVQPETLSLNKKVTIPNTVETKKEDENTTLHYYDSKESIKVREFLHLSEISKQALNKSSLVLSENKKLVSLKRLWPVNPLTMLLTPYLVYLRNQSSAKKLPYAIRCAVGKHYEQDIDVVRYYENVNTVHGAAITFGIEIFFPEKLKLTNRFLLQTGTCLHPTDGTFQFLLDKDKNLFAIKKSNTGTKTTEVHVLSAASNYQKFIIQTGTCLHPTDSTFQFLLDKDKNLFAIKKSNTGTKTTEVHVLSAASNYQKFIIQTGTCLHPTDNTFQFLLDKDKNLFAIKKSNTGTKTTEVHVLSAASNYQKFIIQTRTCLHPTDSTLQFLLDKDKNLFVIKKNGSTSTEVSVLSATSNYQDAIENIWTCLHPTDNTFEFLLDNDCNLFAIKKGNTDTKTTEVYIIELQFRRHVDWLLHELEHVDQYKNAGGIEPFLWKYFGDSILVMLRDHNFNLHDNNELEKEANEKRDSIFSIVMTDLYETSSKNTRSLFHDLSNENTHLSIENIGTLQSLKKSKGIMTDFFNKKVTLQPGKNTIDLSEEDLKTIREEVPDCKIQ